MNEAVDAAEEIAHDKDYANAYIGNVQGPKREHV